MLPRLECNAILAHRNLCLLGAGNSPASASQSVGITGVSHCAQPTDSFLNELGGEAIFESAGLGVEGCRFEERGYDTVTLESKTPNKECVPRLQGRVRDLWQKSENKSQAGHSEAHL